MPENAPQPQPVVRYQPYADPRPRPASGAPNVVVIVLDDLGYGQVGCFGSDIETPHIDRLAAGGLRYNRFHVTALCSPSRACLMTGRNHHSVGVGFLVDMPLAFPGYDGLLPKSAGTLPRVLRDAGYSTFAIGKWHLVPRGERSHAGPFDRWPLGYGFERYYGFLQGDTNQWAPNLVRDNHYVEPPAGPEDGYHLTEDLTDTAIRCIRDQQHSAPGKPFFMYFAPGAMHAPHHTPPGWADRYAGRYDGGWEHWRDDTFARQVALGVVPSTARLTERPPWIQAWAGLSADERRLYSGMYENYAGFLTHTDAQIGRLITYLDESGQLDNTVVMFISDNGASAEGGQHGTFNEHRFTQGLPETAEANLRLLDGWGGHRSYSHYAWGWAWAGNSPFRLWKRYTWLGGTRSPLIVHWPRGIAPASAGAVRPQICHVIDLMPTVLDACGVTAPSHIDGIEQRPVHGASLVPSFDDATAPDPRPLQYFEMLGSRSIIAGEWKATTDHVSKGVVDEERLLVGSRSFADDAWALFRLDGDFTEATDVAAEHPEVITELRDLWLMEAGRHGVMPMDDSLIGRLGSMVMPLYPAPQRATFRPGGSPVHDECIPILFGGGTISAVVDVPEAPTGAGADGVLCALGDWTSGFALYLRHGHPAFAINIAGESTIVNSPLVIAPGRHTVDCILEALGPDGTGLRLRCDGVVVASGASPLGIPFAWQHGGAGLRIGYDTGFPVCDEYACPFPWTGVIHEVTIEAGSGASPERQHEVRAALHSE